ncbi:acyl-CoA dehydrogenase family protein [Sphaerisporangium corydalis]|uniref:Acyl-CoA dehydrogenase family protein n=1 Tax=Sphaerisporangium corydalis TaxID=1441875 RepID=A0ABV9E4N6_9ACTN|nr:acyl-CoA dehydrogenase family protein [Sphaerisporangium corydalis]
MNFAFNDDQLALAATVRSVLRAHCPPRAVRDAGRDGDRTPAWSQLAKAGLFAMLVPERHDGLGLGMTDAILAFEETGRAALPGPVAETVAAAPVLLAAGTAPAASALRGIAAGTTRVSVRLGDQVYVPDADLADLLILEEDGEPYAVPAGAVRLTPQPGVDPVRRLFAVAFDPAPRTRLPHAGPAALRGVTVAVAAQLIGLARHLLETTVEYARTRRQFGTAVGTFQAVKHQLADVAIGVDFAAPLVYAAAFAIDRDLPSADRDVSAAKAAAGEAADRAARVALQVHGAIGYTDELDLRLWLARVWSLASAYGDTGLHRARLRSAILGTPELRRWP